MTARPTWEEGLAILRGRQEYLPAAVAKAAAAPLPAEELARALTGSRAVVTTGVGSSLAHARYLAWLLRTEAAIPSWDVSTGAFLDPPGPEAAEQTLVLFSQGLSPNARFPLAHIGRYRAAIVVTAVTAFEEDRFAALERAEHDGALFVPMPCAPEYTVLLRLLGPAVGFVVALRMAVVAGAKLVISPAALEEAVRAASERARAALAGVDARIYSEPITLVAAGGYAAFAHNLAAKVLEGMFLGWPAALDALELSHGALQEASGKPRTFVALRLGGPREAALFARARRASEPQHRWLDLEARLGLPLAILEHEAMMNEVVLGAIASRRLDQWDWPGKGCAAPLYDLASVADLEGAAPAYAAGAPATPETARLEDLTWREIEARIAAGQTTAVVPLGATEQHGPHLPLAVDAWIAEALAARFCAKVPEALAAPVVAVGCSPEHMAFPGTLSLSAESLAGVTGDMIASLARHGFRHIVVFSAHGGNDALLAESEALLRERALPAGIIVVHGIDAIARLWQEASKRAGAPSGAAGHHAGEFETSIIAAIRPDAVRWGALRPGISGDVPDPQSLFYPSLRDHAPEGVVGDPSQAAAIRGEGYLQAWTDLLVERYRASIEGGG